MCAGRKLVIKVKGVNFFSLSLSHQLATGIYKKREEVFGENRMACFETIFLFEFSTRFCRSLRDTTKWFEYEIRACLESIKQNPKLAVPILLLILLNSFEVPISGKYWIISTNWILTCLWVLTYRPLVLGRLFRFAWCMFFSVTDSRLWLWWWFNGQWAEIWKSLQLNSNRQTFMLKFVTRMATNRRDHNDS